jgi:hypothetical protein
MLRHRAPHFTKIPIRGHILFHLKFTIRHHWRHPALIHAESLPAKRVAAGAGDAAMLHPRALACDSLGQGV